jgi:hypothetical protein
MKKPACAGFFIESCGYYLAAAGAAASVAGAAGAAASVAEAATGAAASVAGAATGAVVSAAFSPQADRDRASRAATRAENFIFNFLSIEKVRLNFKVKVCIELPILQPSQRKGGAF